MSDVEQTIEPVVEVTPEVNPIEEQARDQGWVSETEWVESGRDKNEWRPAKEFVERGELYKSIHSTKRELKQTQAALSALQRHHQMVFEKAHAQAIRDLRAEKRLALREGDIDRLEEIETEIEQTQDRYQQEKSQMLTAQQAAEAVGPAPEFQLFVERNPWYLQDKSLRDEADAIGFVFMNNGGSKDNLLAHVEKEVRRKFPEKFGGKRAAPNAVAASNRIGGPRKGDIQLDPLEQKIMRDLVDGGVMTEAEYKAELRKAKGIK